jgi:hypothetical protein
MLCMTFFFGSFGVLQKHNPAVTKASQADANFGESLFSTFPHRAMYFPVLFSWLRRLGRGLVYELFQLALWMAFGLHTIGGLRSALGGGGENRAARLSKGPAIRPRRPEAKGRARFTYPSAA